MNESLRQAYLEAMGIQVYFPRRSLPAALKSPHYDMPPLVDSVEPADSKSTVAIKLAANETEQVLSVKAVDQLRASTAALAKSKRSRDVGPTSPHKGQRGKSPAETATAVPLKVDRFKEESSAAELRFDLNYFLINQRLAVIDEVPHQQGGDSSVAANQLLLAIVAALDIKLGDSKLTVEKFTWPLPAAMHIETNPKQAASDALQGFIQRRHEIDQFENLLVFAVQLDELLKNKSEQSNQCDFKDSDGDFHLTLCASLHAMLANPSLKKSTWQDVQPLRKRLTV